MPCHRRTPQHRTPRSTWKPRVAAVVLLAGFSAPTQATVLHTATEPVIDHATNIIKHQKGDPYAWGGSGPGSFDCSGLLWFGFTKAGAFFPRTSNDQANYIRHIPRRLAHRGDFVMYHDPNGYVFHIALFAGRHPDGHIWVIESAHPGTVVRHVPIWRYPHWFGTLR